MKYLAFLMALTAFAAGTAVGQDEKINLEVKDLKVAEVETPQFQASNVGEKRWRPKKWLELDMTFEVKPSKAVGGRNGGLDGMTVNFYVAFNKRSADGKTEAIKGTFNYVDIPAGEVCHALAYVSPATLRRILEKDQFTSSSDIQASACEVTINGTTVAGKSTPNTRWWEAPQVVIVDGAILPKRDTPFGILWGDYDVGVKK